MYGVGLQELVLAGIARYLGVLGACRLTSRCFCCSSALALILTTMTTPLDVPSARKTSRLRRGSVRIAAGI
jgi:hypothetical protein